MAAAASTWPRARAMRGYHGRSLVLIYMRRAATAILPFEHPKLAVVALMDAGEGFVASLEKAIKRSRKTEIMKLMEITPQN